MSEGRDQPDTIGIEAVDEWLVEAIQDGRLRPLLAELQDRLPGLEPTARSRVREAASALAAIDHAVESERRRLAGLLGAAGVATRPPAEERLDRPLHLLALEVAAVDVDAACGALTTAGYRRLAPAGDAAWRAFRATRGRCDFQRGGAEPFRVELTWPSSWAARGLAGRLLAPHAADFDVVSFPRGLWPGYILLRLVRLPLRLTRRSREALFLGPFLETPHALIEPLLRFAGLSPDELLVDLGCGDGRLLVAAARAFGCRARGVETDVALVARARAAVAEAGVDDRVEVVCGDAAVADIEDADVVVAFLPVASVEALLPSLLDRLPTGARLVVHEQERLGGAPADARTPLISPSGISVAHRWGR